MNRIDKIHINNFKFFGQEKPIELGGKHLLLYGENGAGKSTIYWSLYTLFEAPFKNDDTDLIKYFEMGPDKPWSLVNIHAKEVLPAGSGNYDSFISLTTDDPAPINFRLSKDDLAIRTTEAAKMVNYASDFIQYKLLSGMHNFWHSVPVDLFDFFVDTTLQHVQFPEVAITRNGSNLKFTNAFDIWQQILKGLEFTTSRGKTPKPILAYKRSNEYKEFEKLVSDFNIAMSKLIDFINQESAKLLVKLGYANFKFHLKYTNASFKKAGDSKYKEIPFKVDLIISEYEGKPNVVHRAHSFLNEAKLNAIGISVRLAVLLQKFDHPGLKFLILDDLLVSLDMNNRDKLLDLLFDKENKILENYQVLFFTHDKSLYYFVGEKVKQWDSEANWVFKEIYVGTSADKKKEFPVFIDSDLEHIDKAKKYFSAGDYSTSALYVRKELEKIAGDRLTDEFKIGADGFYKSLTTLWGYMKERYASLGNPISPEIIKNFEQTKLMVLNPQAHHNLSEPVYRSELEKAFDLIDKLKAYPVPVAVILLSEGIQMKFTHPSFNYIFDFELLTPFQIDDLKGAKQIVFPKCRVLSWQFEGKDFWDVDAGKTSDEKFISEVLANKDDRLNKCLKKLQGIKALSITPEMFQEQTKSTNGIWSLKEVMDKSKITF